MIQASTTLLARLARSDVRAPSITVVIPTLDERQTLVRLLREVHGQLGPLDEVLVVDGGSRDGTPELARAAGLAGVRVLQAPRGRAAQMNAGAALARGEWLFFLHADSTLNGAVFEGLRRRIAGHAASWGFYRLRIDDPAPIFRWIELGLNLRSTGYGTPSGDQGIFVRRDLFAAVAGYDEEVPFLEDLLLVDRLLERAAPEAPAGWLGTSARRWRAEGVLRTVLRMWAIRAAFRLGVSPGRLATLARNAGYGPSRMGSGPLS